VVSAVLKVQNTSSTHPVSGNAPFALLNHGLDGLRDLGLTLADLLDGKVLEWPGILDVAQSGLQVALLGGDLLDSRLGSLDSPSLERIDDTGDLAQVVSDGLEGGEDLFGVLNGRLVLQDGLVSGHVDGRDRVGEGGVLGRGGGVSSSEGRDLGDGLCWGWERSWRREPKCAIISLQSRICLSNVSRKLTLGEPKTSSDLGPVLEAAD